MTLGESIRQARKKVKLRELAELTGYSITYLSDIQRNRTNPSVKALLKICAALKIRPSEILNRLEGETVTRYAILTYRSWKDVALQHILPDAYPLYVAPEFGSGFIRVFDSMDDAVKYATDGQRIVPIETKDNDNGCN